MIEFESQANEHTIAIRVTATDSIQKRVVRRSQQQHKEMPESVQ